MYPMFVRVSVGDSFELLVKTGNSQVRSLLHANFINDLPPSFPPSTCFGCCLSPLLLFLPGPGGHPRVDICFPAAHAPSAVLGTVLAGAAGADPARVGLERRLQDDGHPPALPLDSLLGSRAGQPRQVWTPTVARSDCFCFTCMHYMCWLILGCFVVSMGQLAAFVHFFCLFVRWMVRCNSAALCGAHAVRLCRGLDHVSTFQLWALARSLPPFACGRMHQPATLHRRSTGGSLPHLRG